MSKPTPAEVRTCYKKLDFDDLEDKIQCGIDRGWSKILACAADCWDVSTWSTSCPPLIKQWVVDYAFYFTSGRAVHTGASLKSGDEMALKTWEELKEELEKIADCKATLLDENDEIIEPLSSNLEHVHLRTTEPVFDMKKSECWRVKPPSDGEDFK